MPATPLRRPVGTTAASGCAVLGAEKGTRGQRHGEGQGQHQRPLRRNWRRQAWPFDLIRMAGDAQCRLEVLWLDRSVEVRALFQEEPDGDNSTGHCSDFSGIDGLGGEQRACDRSEYRDVPGNDVAGCERPGCDRHHVPLAPQRPHLDGARDDDVFSRCNLAVYAER